MWHHDLNWFGKREHDDCLDPAILGHLVNAGYDLGLCGRAHRTNFASYTYNDFSLPIVAAGSLCAGPHQRGESIPRLYNLIHLEGNTARVHTRSRETKDVPWRPYANWGAAPQSHFDVTLKTTLRQEGAAARKTTPGEPAGAPSDRGGAEWRKVRKRYCDYVEKELTPEPELGRFLRSEIENGQCLVILDGLDEVADVELRTRVTDRIRQMVAASGKNRFLVTSRIVGYDRSPLTHELQHATLEELTSEDQERFVRLWYAAIGAELSESSQAGGAEDLIEALRDKPQIARLAANPLLLTIIVLMHWRGVKLPNRRVQVYQNATDTLVEYWTAQRGCGEARAQRIRKEILLLEIGSRSAAINILRNLVRNEPGQAPAAAQALLRAGEQPSVDRQLLRDMAMAARDSSGVSAISTLLQMGDESVALPAALGFLATSRPIANVGGKLVWALTEGLIENDRTRQVGLAAAAWLALRPGYPHRIDACQALLEAGRVEQSISPLWYLACECHDESSQRACDRLLVLREAERVVAILALAADRGDPSLRYQACAALALANERPEAKGYTTSARTELKTGLLDERTRAYHAALTDLSRAGSDALDAIEHHDEQTQAAQAIGRLSLQWLTKSSLLCGDGNGWYAVPGCAWAAATVCLARLELLAGRANHARQHLVDLLAGSGQALSLPVRLHGLRALAAIGTSDTIGLLISTLEDESHTCASSQLLRWAAWVAPPLCAPLSRLSAIRQTTCADRR